MEGLIRVGWGGGRQEWMLSSLSCKCERGFLDWRSLTLFAELASTKASTAGLAPPRLLTVQNISNLW